MTVQVLSIFAVYLLIVVQRQRQQQQLTSNRLCTALLFWPHSHRKCTASLALLSSLWTVLYGAYHYQQQERRETKPVKGKVSKWKWKCATRSGHVNWLATTTTGGGGGLLLWKPHSSDLLLFLLFTLWLCVDYQAVSSCVWLCALGSNNKKWWWWWWWKMGARSKVQTRALNVFSCARMWWHFPATAEKCVDQLLPKHSVYYLPPTYLPLPAHYRWPSSSSSSSSSSAFAFLLFFLLHQTVSFNSCSQFSSDTAAAAAAAALDHWFWLSPSIHFLFYTFFLLVFYARGINGGGGGGGGHCLHAIVAFFFFFLLVDYREEEEEWPSGTADFSPSE